MNDNTNMEKTLNRPRVIKGVIHKGAANVYFSWANQHVTHMLCCSYWV